MTTDVDHRADQSPVRDQGDRLTCVGFAVSAAHEWMDPQRAIRSAEDAIWAAHQMDRTNKFESTRVILALQGLQIHRHASEESWQYGQPAWPAGRPTNASIASNQRDLPAWREITGANHAAIVSELGNGVAVILSLRYVFGAWSARGVVDAPAGAVTRTGHSVLAVGNVSADSSLIIKNSWGIDWGVGGYGFITKRYLDVYLKRAFVVGGA